MTVHLTRVRATFVALLLLLNVVALADTPVGADARDAALLARMTLQEKVNQLMLLSKGTMTGPDSAGRPNISAEELARTGIGFQMSALRMVGARRQPHPAHRGQGIAARHPGGVRHRHHSRLLDGVSRAAGAGGHLRRRTTRASSRRSPGSKAIRTDSAGRSRRWSITRSIRAGAASSRPSANRRWCRATTPSPRSKVFIARSPTCPARPRRRTSASRAASSTTWVTARRRAARTTRTSTSAERAIRQFHLPPFAAGVAAGAPSVMPAFTTGTGGVPMSANKHLLQDVLRGELGFDGVLVSDYAAITEMRDHGTAADDLEAAVQALRDGTMTVDMEDGVYYAQLAQRSGRRSRARRRRSIAKCCARWHSSASSGCSKNPTCPRIWKSACAFPPRIARPRARSRASPSCC